MSIRFLMSSTPLLDAASSSWIQYERPSWNEMQDSHLPQGSISSEGLEQLMAFANILAVVVLPTPRGPQKRYACASFPLMMEFFRVCAILSCPISVSNESGLYFLADTIYSDIFHKFNEYSSLNNLPGHGTSLSVPGKMSGFPRCFLWDHHRRSGMLEAPAVGRGLERRPDSCCL